MNFCQQVIHQTGLTRQTIPPIFLKQICLNLLLLVLLFLHFPNQMNASSIEDACLLETTTTATSNELTINNAGTCEALVYIWLATGDIYKTTIQRGQSWKTTTNKGDMWRVVSNHPNWDIYDQHYTVTANAVQQWNIYPRYCEFSGCSLIANAGEDLYFCQYEGGQNFSASATGGKAPYTYEWSNGLGRGQHKTAGSTSTTAFTVTVTDANGCQAVDEVVLFIDKPSVQTTPDLYFCQYEGGQNFSANATGGKAPYTYEWSNGLGRGQHKTSGSTTTQTFTVTVTDAIGCIATDEITIFVEKPSVETSPDLYFCKFEGGQNFSANATGGTAPYTYEWSNGLGRGQYKTAGSTTTQTFTVTVTDANGCTGTDKITIFITDKDGDGVCDDEDCEPNNPSIPAPVGSACNDGNPNTQNDKIQGDGCSCAGVVPTCPDGSALKTPGASCNDGNPNTQNDKIQGDGCSCVGVVPTCPDGSAVKTPGASCNDGNPNTQNDKIQGDGCSCAGVVPTCPDGSAVKTPGASCNDGNPNTQNDKIQGDGCSCAGVVPTCPDGSALKTPGATCNDGNPNTENDRIQGDGCSCVGVIPTCNDGSPLKTPGATCNDGNPNTENDRIQGDGCSCAGVVPTCNDGSALKTPGTKCNDKNRKTENDRIQSDGCSCVGVVPTCNDGSPSKTPGATCNDGNPNTENDRIQGDGCSCVGVVPTCNDGSPLKTPGATCNDGNPNTENDRIQGDGCSCVGVIPTCNDGSPLKTPGATCNDGNPNTENDRIQGNGCSCQGTTAPSGGTITLTCPADILADPVPGNLVPFDWSVPTGTTDCATGGLTITQIGGPALGTTLLSDEVTYDITYEATDNCGNTTQCTFTFTEQRFVADIEFTSCPTAITVAASSADGAIVTWQDPVLSTNCPDGAEMFITGTNLSSGDVFPVGTTQIIFQGIGNGVSNGCGVSTVCIFNVTVTEFIPTGCTDADADGICADLDCDDTDPNLPAAIGSACNDGDTTTENDVIGADGCSCAGTPKVTPTNPCEATIITAGNGIITIEGLDGSPVVAVKVFTTGWSPVYQCWDAQCNKPTEVISTGLGDFLVFVDYYDASYGVICQVKETITVTGEIISDPCATKGGDTDGDGICDTDDNCPDTPNADQADADGNGVGDVCEPVGCICPTVVIPVCGSNGITYNNSCEAECAGVTWINGACIIDPCAVYGDTDGDGICDTDDNCPDTPNADQADADGDGIGNVCDTVDPPAGGCEVITGCAINITQSGSSILFDNIIGSTVVMIIDLSTWTTIYSCAPWAGNCQGSFSVDDLTVGGKYLVKIQTYNPNCNFQSEFTISGEDCQGGGSVHPVDPCAAKGGDTDGDGICDADDNCLNTANAAQADTDGDGIGDACDTVAPVDPCAGKGIDTDGDGICDAYDNCLNTANSDQADTDGDGIGDACDTVAPPSTGGGCDVITGCDINITQSGTSILFDNITGSTVVMVVDKSTWTTIYSCAPWSGNCQGSFSVDNLTTGVEYMVKIQTYNPNCTFQEDILITGIDCDYVSNRAIMELTNHTLANKSMTKEKVAIPSGKGKENATKISLGVEKDIPVSVYPVPAYQTLNINLGRYLGKQGQLNLINSMGQQAISLTIDQLNPTPVQLDVSKLSTGFYYLQVVINGELKEVKKVVIEN